MNHFILASNGSSWIATTTGLCNFDPSKKVIHLYQPLPSEKSILANHLHSLSEDKEGNIWAATVFNGIVKFDIRQKAFKIFENDPIDPHSLSRNDVLSLIHDRSGILWVGTWTGGIDKWDKIRWKFHKYKMTSLIENAGTSAEH